MVTTKATNFNLSFVLLSVVVSAVIGIISIQPIKLNIDWILTEYTLLGILLFNMSNTLYLHVINQIIDVIKLLIKANNKVFVVVPNMFLPISFIECFKFSILILLSFSINSLTDEDISPFLIITLSPILYFSVTTEDEVSSYL